MYNIIFIKENYPVLCEAAMKSFIFDKKIKDEINQENDFMSMYELNEFNQEIDNVKKNPEANNKYSFLAKQYNLYFTEYTNQLYLLKDIIGIENTLNTTDILRGYFQKNRFVKN